MKIASQREAFTQSPGTSGDVLVEAGWLRDHLTDPQVRVVEVDVSPANYRDWHIDGAVLWNVYADLKDGDYRTVDAAAVFTTDPQLQSGKYVVLNDTKFIFGFQNVGLVASKSALKAEGSDFLKTVNKVSSLLTQKAIITLNAAVELNQQSPASVAKAFLKANHLL